MLSGLAESKVRIVSPDIGGGFGNKVPVYPGYVVAIVASIVLGRPVKWIESRIENISTTGFARDYHGISRLVYSVFAPGPTIYRQVMFALMPYIPIKRQAVLRIVAPYESPRRST